MRHFFSRIEHDFSDFARAKKQVGGSSCLSNDTGDRILQNLLLDYFSGRPGRSFHLQGRHARHMGTVAIDVPLIVAVAFLEAIPAETMSVPGAKMSTHPPKFEKLAR